MVISPAVTCDERQEEKRPRYRAWKWKGWSGERNVAEGVGEWGKRYSMMKRSNLEC